MISTESGYPSPEAGALHQAMMQEVVDDLELARAIVQDVRSIPGVLDMSPGRYALAATYGPGEHIKGVVLLHSEPSLLTVEVHIVTAFQPLMNALPPFSVDESASGETAVLLKLAEQVRHTVYQVVQTFGLPAPLAVDVFIDDIQ